LDTNKTAGRTAGSAQQEAGEPRFDWLLIVAVGAFLVIAVAIGWNIAQGDEPAIDTDSMVSGFDYNAEATTGRMAAPGVTTQYFGHTDELFPERDLVSGFQYQNEATPGRTVLPGVIGQYFGHSEELFPPKPVSGFDHNTDATTGKSAADGVTTTYFGNNPEFD
jgi:hypothetical protein